VLAIDSATAREIGVIVPEHVLRRADNVIG